MVARGLCSAHHKQLTAYKMELRPILPRWKGVSCSVPECGRPVRCRGYCDYHHKAALAGAEMKLPESSVSATKFEGGLQVCTKCKRALPRDSFWADKRVVRGTVPQCKECMGARYKGWAKKNPEVRKKTTREWFSRNKAKTKAWNRKYHEANKERLAKHNKKYREENREAISERRCARYQQNREVIIAKVGAYTKRRRKEDPVFRARANLRTRLTEVLRGRRKVAKTMELVGCTLTELRAHLESLFAPGMSWDNYGTWTLDHVMPCAMFDLLDPAQQRECFHYTNLQPLWAKDNIRKSDRSPEEWAKISGGSAR